MQRLIHRLLPVHEPLVSFQDERGGACYGYTARGHRYDVSRLVPLQNPIENDRDFTTYMLMEARDRFFWLEQQMVDGMGAGWWVTVEMLPHYPPTFISEFKRLFARHAPPGHVDLPALLEATLE